MNEPDFENHLRTIRPASPRHALEQQIAAQLAPMSTAGVLPVHRATWLERILPPLGWSALGAAVAVVIMLALQLAGKMPERTQAEPLAKESKPEVEQQILEVADEGLVDESGLNRLVRYESVERRQWTDADGAVTVIEVPREDLVLVPVSFQ